MHFQVYIGNTQAMHFAGKCDLVQPQNAETIMCVI